MFLLQTITDMPPTVCIWLAYLIPSYSMSGLYMQGFDNYNGFYLYLGEKMVTVEKLMKISWNGLLHGTAIKS